MNNIIHSLIYSPVFGVMYSLACFFVSQKIAKKINHPLVSVMIVSLVLSIAGLVVTGIPVEAYQKGGSIINFLLGPMTIALAIPLFKQMDQLKKHFVPIVIGITVGSIVAIVSALVLGRLFGLDHSAIMSLAPKSTTAAIAMDLSKTFGGNPSLTIALTTVAGITGFSFGPPFLRAFKINHPTAKGISLGTASHALGTNKALEMGEEEGAMGSLAIGLAGIITTFLLPLILSLYK